LSLKITMVIESGDFVYEFMYPGLSDKEHD
jgi:hypothetical protein